MRGIAAVAAAILVTACGYARAGTFADLAVPPGEQCRAAIAAAERAQDIPPHLLAAIGRVESGRRDPKTGRWAPWPWTIDVDGHGAFLPTKQAAIAAVHTLQARGILSIDVGCVQINLWHHGGAFASLQQAFDPARNAAYGARFLKALFHQTQDWDKAAGLYHSSITALASDYRRKVMAAWPGAAAEPATLGPMQALARAWAATLDDLPKASIPSVTAVRPWPAVVALPRLRRRQSVQQASGSAAAQSMALSR